MKRKADGQPRGALTTKSRGRARCTVRQQAWGSRTKARKGRGRAKRCPPGAKLAFTTGAHTSLRGRRQNGGPKLRKTRRQAAGPEGRTGRPAPKSRVSGDPPRGRGKAKHSSRRDGGGQPRKGMARRSAPEGRDRLTYMDRVYAPNHRRRRRRITKQAQQTRSAPGKSQDHPQQVETCEAASWGGRERNPPRRAEEMQNPSPRWEVKVRQAGRRGT